MKRLIPVTLFAISMGFLESAVVVYIRALYYPEGFHFPLKLLSESIALTELIREAATIIMLAAVAMIASRRWMIRVAWFIYMFAIWDICYYLFLHALLGWPESLLTWDILFMIPTTWVGPVLAPVINSLTMIILAGVIILADRRIRGQVGPVGPIGRGGQAEGIVKVSMAEWGLLIVGSVVTIAGYMQDYLMFMLQRFSIGELFSWSARDAVNSYAMEYIPASFNWWVFLTGTLMFLAAIVSFSYRNFRKEKT